MGLLLCAIGCLQCSKEGKDNLAGKDVPSQMQTFVYADSFSLRVYCKDLYEHADMKHAFVGKTQADFEEWQEEFRDALKDRLGISRLENRLDSYRVKAERVDSEDVGYAVRERWRVWTEPGVPLPVVLLLPKDRDGELPLMITPHGHDRHPGLYAGIYWSEKERMERCHRSPHISQKHCPYPCHKRRRSGRICKGYSVIARVRIRDLRVSSVCLPVCFPALYDHTAQRCPVPADKLCGRMYDNISPMFKRPEQVRCGKSIVHNKHDPMGMGSLNC